MRKKKIRRNATKVKRGSVRKTSLSAADIQRVRHLAEQLGALIPLNGFRTKFTLTAIAKERDLGRYLVQGNKKDVYATFITGLLKSNKKITLKKLVRESLPRAIERRHANGNPVLKAEADNLSKNLFALGIDLRKEIDDLQLPSSRPAVVPPPPEVRKALDAIGLHPGLLPNCKDLFLDGHINEAVRKAAEKLESTVQRTSGSHKQGKELMGEAFSEKSPLIQLNGLVTTSDINEQDGYRFIAMGVMVWWRNTLSHGDEPMIAHHEALGRLATISNLLHRLDIRAE